MIETWLPVPDFGDLYNVSDRGRILSFHRGAYLLCTPPGNNGYPQFNLCRGGEITHVHVHAIELAAFSGPCPPGLEARHLNDVKTDNRWPENLVWGTRQDNQGTDRLANGLSNRGERHGLHKLTEAEVLDIYARLQQGETPAVLAAVYGRSRQCINHIAAGRRWSWLTGAA